MYFGYLIPKHQKVLRLDTTHLRAIIGFKHGLMLLHQFIDFIIKIHMKENLRFGHLDFQSLYFVQSKNNKLVLKKLPSKDDVKLHTPMGSPQSKILDENPNNEKKSSNQFTVELLFIDRNLTNLTTEDEDNLLRNPKFIS